MTTEERIIALMEEAIITETTITVRAALKDRDARITEAINQIVMDSARITEAIRQMGMASVQITGADSQDQDARREARDARITEADSQDVHRVRDARISEEISQDVRKADKDARITEVIKQVGMASVRITEADRQGVRRVRADNPEVADFIVTLRTPEEEPLAVDSETIARS